MDNNHSISKITSYGIFPYKKSFYHSQYHTSSMHYNSSFCSVPVLLRFFFPYRLNLLHQRRRHHLPCNQFSQHINRIPVQQHNPQQLLPAVVVAQRQQRQAIAMPMASNCPPGDKVLPLEPLLVHRTSNNVPHWCLVFHRNVALASMIPMKCK